MLRWADRAFSSKYSLDCLYTDLYQFHFFRRQKRQNGPMEIYGKHYDSPAWGIWCKRCRRAGHETKMCAAREPRRFDGLCDTCCWFEHLSCDCLLQRDRLYSAHILGSRILFAKHANENYVQATKVAHDGSSAVCLNPGMPATTVPSATVPPAMAAAVLRPGATTSAAINHLHVSLGHAHEGNLRETVKQMEIRVTKTLLPCSEYAAAKGVRRSVSRPSRSSFCTAISPVLCRPLPEGRFTPSSLWIATTT